MQEIHDRKPVSSTVRWLAHGPNPGLMTFEGYRINGCSYSTQSHDNGRTVQNSGVTLVATTMQVSSAKDRNPIVSDMSFYGVIQEIWEINYNTFKIPLFKCDWVENQNGVRIDDLGFTLVKLNRIGHTSDPFILATQARQVFYIEDPIDAQWSIVITPPQKDFADTCYDDELGDTSLDCPSVAKCTSPTDIDEPDIPYVRDGCEGTWVDT